MDTCACLWRSWRGTCVLLFLMCVMDIYVSTFDLNVFYLSRELQLWQIKHILSVEAANVLLNTQPGPPR